jgi:hypothetical protein
MKPQAARLALRAGLAGAAMALVFAALTSVGAAVSPSGTPAATEQYGGKVTICHRTKSKKNPFRTIRVARSAVRAHLRHGDKLGPCANATFQVCHKAKKAQKRTVKVKGLVKLKRHVRHGDRIGPCKKAKQAKKAKGKKGRK